MVTLIKNKCHHMICEGFLIFFSFFGKSTEDKVNKSKHGLFDFFSPQSYAKVSDYRVPDYRTFGLSIAPATLTTTPHLQIYIYILFLTIILRRHDTKNYFVFIPCLSLILTKVSDNTAQLETKRSAGSLLQRVPTVNEIRIMCHFFMSEEGIF